MKVAVYTLTRDRLEYTKFCFNTLWKNAGHDFDHFIVDNGSEDGTDEWLRAHADKFKKVLLNDRNEGISKASNEALKMIFQEENKARELYDLIIKFDNDCEVISENIIGQICEIYQDIFEKDYLSEYILSPKVEGIANQPSRETFENLGGRRIGITSIVGGLFHIVPAEIYKSYQYPEKLPKAWGQDDDICAWFKQKGGKVGYIEGLVVNHYKTTAGQAKDFPAYFERKWKEEKNA